MLPLRGCKVIDLSTLLPGPLASLMLAEAGAEVIKIERAGIGDELRHMSDTAFAMLNRGKKSIALDLKAPADLARLKRMIAGADVLIEQFRPGVMARLGLSWAAVQKLNPRIIYCSITGYGQTGSRAQKAGHDLNYVAESGLLPDHPAMPPVLIADIMGGAYPALINILLALAARDKTGKGNRLDIAMADNLYPAMIWGLAGRASAKPWPKEQAEFFQGALPRYRFYETADGRWLAVGAVEERFWQEFCDVIELAPHLRKDGATPQQTGDAVAAILRSRPARHWQSAFEGRDVCCSVVATLDEALNSPEVKAQAAFAREVVTPGGQVLPALPLPICAPLKSRKKFKSAPALGGDGPKTGPGSV